MKKRSFEDALNDLFKGISSGIQGAFDEDPEGCKNLTTQELFEKSSDWAGKHVLLTDESEGEDE
jgi:hypothetical protein